MSGSSNKCVRTHDGKQCGERFGDHVDRLCPDGSGLKFLHAQSPKRASSSWSGEAVTLGIAIMDTLLRGGDARDLVRRPAAAQIVGYLKHMHASIERRKLNHE